MYNVASDKFKLKKKIIYLQIDEIYQTQFR